MPAKSTPMLERYLEVKAEHPGTLLLFRMGDFYELFFEDAEIGARDLGLTLTSRDKNSDNPVAMAGFPHHGLRTQLAKLIAKGHRVAVCEQVEDPKTAKGMVRREVTQVVTPGTLVDDELLDPRSANFLAALHADKAGTVGLAWLDVSTGEFCAADMTARQAADELARLDPAEVLVSETPPKAADEARALWEAESALWTSRAAYAFAAEEAKRKLCAHFGTQSLEGFDCAHGESPGVTAAGALLDYATETQRSAVGHVTRLTPHRRGERLIIDEATRRSLELTRTIRDGSREGSLLGVIDETVTPMGARLLADWLSGPLTDVAAIEARLDAVEELKNDAAGTRALRDLLNSAYDLERLVARLATGRATPRDLSCLGRTLDLLPAIEAKLGDRQSDLLHDLFGTLDLCPESRARIAETLVEDPPVQTGQGGMIAAGVSADLDEYRSLARGGKEWIAKYQAEESERSGIPNLKVGFNKVFGYYLEVTASHRDKVPADYIRKQTLKNQERYITPPLKEYEQRVLGAEEKAVALEIEIFDALRDEIARDVPRLKATAAVLATLDVLAGFATRAASGGYCRPTVTADPVLHIGEGRHPVIEKLNPSGTFVPNGLVLAARDTEAVLNSGGMPAVCLLTGPNMAGKSTYIRQAALIAILAQTGSFVPAASATVGVCDRVFARVGASDDVGRGQSTFMVEMTETARILNSATRRSLVILDEIGRGTSTYDGLSLAWAVTEHLHDAVGCRTLFATHYHELTTLPRTLPGVANANVSVHEADGEVVFLHRIVPGPADRSYGVHVARLAGVPKPVVERADAILETLESGDGGKTANVPKPKKPAVQLGLFAAEPHPLLEELKQIDVDDMTPREALAKLADVRDRLREV
ncbi:MAG: DNA mismatch repair protein MutS [Planctomycetota bacterium]